MEVTCAPCAPLHPAVDRDPLAQYGCASLLSCAHAHRRGRWAPGRVTVAVFALSTACDKPKAEPSAPPGSAAPASTREVVEGNAQSIAKRCRRRTVQDAACGLDVPGQICDGFPKTDAAAVECMHTGCVDRFGWTRASSIRGYSEHRASCERSGDAEACGLDHVLRPEAAACIFDAVGFSRRSSPALRVVPGEAYWCSRIQRTDLDQGGYVDRVCVSATGATVVTTPVVATRVDRFP